jgi:hypothetical protein
MVARNAQVRLRPQEVNTGIGIGTIAYNVSQAPDLIDRTCIL